ncbi:MAG: patatin-like phospholipase family protein [Bacteroidales bacterium]|nr:patatin-like phospholipase family protein [Bacteroidales bacterium]
MKRRLVSLMLLLLATFTMWADRPKVALVLCGGGAKGAAHIGVLKVLEEYDIPIDMIVGTSMGAIIGGLYSVGHSATELDSLVMMQDWNSVMTGSISREMLPYEVKTIDDRLLISVPFGGDFAKSLARRGDNPEDAVNQWMYAPEGAASGLIPMGLLGGQNIYRLFTDFTVGYHDYMEFRHLPIPFACVAVDLAAKEEVVLDSGILPMAMRASMAIPGAFAPVRIDDRVFVDGGVKNNYPVDVALNMGADIVIGVLLGHDDEEDTAYGESLPSLLIRLLDVAMDVKMDDAIKNTNVLIAPSVAGYNALSFSTENLRVLIDNGEKAARQCSRDLEDLKSFLDDMERLDEMTFVGPGKAPKESYATMSLRDSIELSTIEIRGDNDIDLDYIERKTKLCTGKKISPFDIEKVVNDLYATGVYSSVTYTLSGETSPFGLVLTLVPNRNHQMGLGARFDTEEITSVLLDIRLNHNKLDGHHLGFSAKVSGNYRADLDYYYQTRGKFRYNVSYGIKRTDTGILFPSGQLFHADYLKNNFETSVSTGRFRKFRTEAGLRMEAFSSLPMSDLPVMTQNYDFDRERTWFASAFVSLAIDNMDDAAFPTKGVRFNSEAKYVSDVGRHVEKSPFLEVEASFRMARSLGHRLVVSPSFDARVLLGEKVPLQYMNMMGGCEASRYTQQQIPFYGIRGVAVMDKILAVGRLDLNYNVAGSHYITLGGNYAASGDLTTMHGQPGVAGVMLGYAYNFMFGPINFNVNWNDMTKKPGAYLGIGYWF